MRLISFAHGFSVTGLRVVREVSRAGSFSAAAERLGYTQSAVSRQVALMERAARSALFERHARGVQLTAAGAVVVRRADAVLSELDRTDQELADLDTRPGGRLRVGAFSTALGALVPRAIAAFSAERPRVRILLREGTSADLLRRVGDGRLDMAVVTPPPEPPGGVKMTKLLDDPLLVAVARGSPLTTKTSVRSDELQEERWVAGSSEPDSPLLGAWTSSQESPEIAYVARDWTAKLGLVAAGLCVTVVPGLALPLLPPTIAVVRIDDPRAFRTTAVATPADALDGPGPDDLTEALHDAAAELAAEVRRGPRL